MKIWISGITAAVRRGSRLLADWLPVPGYGGSDRETFAKPSRAGLINRL